MYLVVAIITSFVVTFILLPIIIKVSTSIDLLDAPDRRKIHSISTPSLGGVAIFSGFLLSTLIALPLMELVQLKFVLAAIIIIFILGVRDDISCLKAGHKLLAQVFSALLVVFFSDIRLTGLYGILGLQDMPEWFNVLSTVFVLVVLTNSFNLIDGIDGLAGSIGILILSFFCIYFSNNGQASFAILCLSLIGALVAFLYFNWNPSKVFMGDTGSMVLGFSVSVMAIKFINHSVAENTFLNLISFKAPVGVSIALLILPIYDTVRVSVIRLLQRRSPLSPDRNHIHHGLLRLGMSHSQATMSLLLFNVFTIGLALSLDQYLKNGELILVLLTSTFMIFLAMEIQLYRKRFEKKSMKVVMDNDVYITKSA